MGVLDTNVTFTATDTITSTKMNNIIDQTVFTGDAVDDSTIGLSAGKLQVKAQGVTSNQLADNAATTSKINNLAVTEGKIANSAITNAKVSESAAIAGTKISPNFGTQTLSGGVGNLNNASDHWAKGGVYTVGTTNRIGQFDTHGSFEINLTSNGYRNSSDLWQSYTANGNNGAAQISLNPAGFIKFNTDASKATGSLLAVTERMRITAAGNVGIGTTSPISKLQVIGSANISQTIQAKDLSLISDASATVLIVPDGDSGSYLRSGGFGVNAGVFRFLAFDNERMRITAAGNVGIGTTSPSTALQVNGTVTATSFAGNVSGSATTLATGRTIALTGDVTGTTGAFDGSANVSAAITIANNAVTTAKINTSAVTANELASNAVTTAKINTGAVTANELASNAVTTVKILDRNVTTTKINTSAVTANELASNAVTTVKILDNNVTTAKINTSAVTANELASNAVTAIKILDRNVTTAKINTGAVTANELASDAVTTVKILDNNITTAKILDNNVTTAKINTGAVTANELALNAVTTVKILDNNITTAKINTAAVTANELASNAVTTVKILDNNITTAKINTSAVTANELASNAITTVKILDNNVTTAKIANAAITASKLNGAQTGTAPIYGARAWVNFDGKSNDDLSGSYTRSGSTAVVVNIPDHGLIAGNRIYIDFTVGSGTAPFDGIYEVATPITSDSFTVLSSVATASTGTAVLKRKTIRAGGNISCVSAAGSSPVVPPLSNLSIQNGVYILNMALAMPDSNFAISGAINENGAMSNGDGNLAINGFAVNPSCAYLTVVDFNSSIDDCLHNSVIVFG